MTSSDRFFESKLKSFATFLDRWRGAPAQLYELTSSHQALTIVLRHDHDGKNLVISCGDPIRIHAPVYWTGSDIQIVRHAIPGERYDGFRLVDAQADVEIISGTLEISEHVKLR